MAGLTRPGECFLQIGTGSGFGMNNQDHISKSLKNKYSGKILKFFDVNPGSGMEKIRILDPGWKKVGSGINIPDP
jgi:hypothetical protein